MSERDEPLEPELGELARLLEQAGDEQRRDLARARTPLDPERERLGEAALQRALERAWRAQERGRRARRWGLAAVLAAAAAVLLVVRPWREPRGTHAPGELLGDGRPRIVHPVGAVEGYAPIEWRDLEGPCLLSVRDGEGRLLFGPRSVTSPFTPRDEESASWPDEIVVEIEWRTPDGTRESASAEARRAR